ncbi:MAG: phosphopentomutase [Pseudomonadota bacterium]
MARALILVMDSFGIGASADAKAFGDEGSDTLGHIAAACMAGKADLDGVRSGPLCLPNLSSLGLANAAWASTGTIPLGLNPPASPEGSFGFAVEQSRGKDTPSGHWEMAGLPVEFDWGYFPRTEPTFPDQLIADLIAECDLTGVLGNKHASGTEIIAELGVEHIRSGKPIVYTSADSVFQIAAHEEYFGLQRLYRVCAVARKLVDAHNIGRVIARPFVGETASDFKRTANRRDLATPPHQPTLLDLLQAAGHQVISIGKIGDIFAHQGTGEIVKADGNDALFDATLAALDRAKDGALIFSNFVDFDQSFGHRRDVAGYAAALEAFDARLPELEAKMLPGDMAVITADHGCDPTWPGSDHTREHVPVVAFGPAVVPAPIGRRGSFADIGQTIAQHLGLDALAHGHSWAA